MTSESEDDEFGEGDIDPEIQISIFNWLAYEITTKHATNLCAKTGKPYAKDVRRKRESGELCLSCNLVPRQGYDSNQKKWLRSGGFCESCLAALIDAGEYCTKCKYAFDQRYMHDKSICKLCEGYPDAPRLNP